MKTQNLAEIAMYHHYLVESFLNLFTKEESTGEVYGEGEDDLVIDLYDYAVIYWRAFYKAIMLDDKTPQGVIPYEVSETLAQYLKFQSSDSKLPDKEAFKVFVIEVCSEFCD